MFMLLSGIHKILFTLIWRDQASVHALPVDEWSEPKHLLQKHHLSQYIYSI